MNYRCTPIVALIGALVAGCGPSAEMAATQTAAGWTATPVPTIAPTHTPSPVPSATPSPSSTPTPTITLTPSITPTLSENFLTIGAGETIRIGYLLAESMELGIESQRGIEVALDDAGRDLLGWTIPSPVEAASSRAPAPGRQDRPRS